MNGASRQISNLKFFIVLITGLLAVAMIAFDGSVEADNKSEVSFNRDIRPIFSNTCYACHGPDKNARKAGLRLDIRDEATRKTKSGAVPIVPGKPDESEIVRRIFSAEKYEMMPPEEAHKTLSAAQKETIKRWIAEGAKYEGHWAYQAVTRPAVPATVPNQSHESHQSYQSHPIDAFIQARLSKENLQPMPEADRRTLIRRVAFDLTGIPPTPREIAAFVADKSPNAYERLVDRLLASDRHAEKQALHWLDAVRYADTAGFHGDNPMPAWPYRDYVLRAFRDNKPFDEFTRQQIAGDLMTSASSEPKIASAYNRLNRVSAEGGLQPKEYIAKYAADRVRTTSVVWLGATMGCAECHDHKFDPYLAKDFYSMKAFFADIKETGLVPDRGRNSFGSKLAMPNEEQRRRFDELSRQLAYAQSELDEKAKTISARRAEWEKQLLEQHAAGKLEWKFQRPTSATSANGAQLKVYNDEKLTVTPYRNGTLITEEIVGDGLVVVSGPNPDNETYTIQFKPGAGEWTALGIQAVQDESLPADRFARGSDRFVLTEVEMQHGERERPGASVEFALATTDGFGQQVENPAMAAIDGNPKTGWGVSFGDGRDGFIALRFAQKMTTTADSVLTVRLRHDSDWRKATMGRFRLALSAGEHSWPDHLAKLKNPMRGLSTEIAAALKLREDQRGDQARKNILTHFKWAAPELQPLAVRVVKIEAERDLLDAQIPRLVVTESTMPAEVRILSRGNFLDESGEVVTPAIPAVFGKVDAMGPRATRLDLANWIVSKENPLTARVFVNRMWRQFFGTGLSKILDDLGSQGEWPTHPELLDWLAAEFMHPTIKAGEGNAGGAHDWDVKHIIRAMVLSEAYRRSSMSTPQLDERDPDNRLLARQSRFRVDAETVRDIALSVSGLLVEKFGGASVKPIQPEGYLRPLNFPQRDYSHDRGEAQYRRGLYVHWQRTFLHPSLATFDAPSREECTVNRVNSNTPLQALVLLNDPIFVEAARVFAQNAMRQGATAEAQIAWAFNRALGRKPGLDERRVLLDLYGKGIAQFQKDPASAKEFVTVGDAAMAKELPVNKVAAMATVTRAILNLHETITRD